MILRLLSLHLFKASTHTRVSYDVTESLAKHVHEELFPARGAHGHPGLDPPQSPRCDKVSKPALESLATSQS